MNAATRRAITRRQELELQAWRWADTRHEPKRRVRWDRLLGWLGCMLYLIAAWWFILKTAWEAL